VTQSELDHAIYRHAQWFEDSSTGERAVFSRYDLSGLNFSENDEFLVNLSGADFTETDLTGTTGGLVSFTRTSLHGAQLSWSHYKQPSFSSASLRYARCDNAVWGWPERTVGASACKPMDQSASFFQTYATRANFSDARIRGLFVEARFVAANLTGTDFSD
jgi:uncharacterized protein YjbI with pentapeptide repeats